MPEPVRVRDNVTGHEYTTYAVDDEGRVDEGLTVLKDEPAVDERTGQPLPAKPAARKSSAAGRVPVAAETVATDQPATEAGLPAELDQAADTPVAAAPKQAAKKSAQPRAAAEQTTGHTATSKEN